MIFHIGLHVICVHIICPATLTSDGNRGSLSLGITKCTLNIYTRYTNICIQEITTLDVNSVLLYFCIGVKMLIYYFWLWKCTYYNYHIKIIHSETWSWNQYIYLGCLCLRYRNNTHYNIIGFPLCRFITTNTVLSHFMLLRWCLYHYSVTHLSSPT